MTSPCPTAMPECGRCPNSFTSSITVFVLDALAPQLEKTPLTEAAQFDHLLSATAVRACEGIAPGPSAEALASQVHCIASGHLGEYAPLAESEGPQPPEGCVQARPGAVEAVGRLLVTDPERGLTLLRRAADDYYER